LLQLRDYAIKPGEMAEWVDEWRTRIAPLRRKHGFEVVGAWTVGGADRFVWILRYVGTKSWEQADSEYYESPERKAMNPDPARHVANAATTFMDSVL
jgi:hypothetical protein